MASPLVVDLPHSLGKEEARARIAGGMDKLTDHIPGGADVRSGWQGDRLNLAVAAMGQEVSAKIDVMDNVVRVEMMLPAMLAFFGSRIEGYLKSTGTKLLEDKGRKG